MDESALDDATDHNTIVHALNEQYHEPRRKQPGHLSNPLTPNDATKGRSTP